jgi:hypothetical protein|tara:strand:+ start:77 stop:526 length:450 start_codon:yes stop_codon:yes gene_type:complete
MAIARGAGTEIIRSIFVEEVDDVARYLIYGAQHHIYTVLNITIQCQAVNSAASWIEARFVGYDAGAGTSAQDLYLFRQVMAAGDTFVFNDKFSFNGHEPVDFTGPVNSVVKQDAIADQGSAVAQYLLIGALHGADDFDVLCTFIDQNNA